RRPLVREDRTSSGHHGRTDDIRQLRRTHVHDVLANRPSARTVRDDRREATRLRARLQQRLASDREADRADAFVVNVRPPAEEPQGALEIAMERPAERVRITFALSLTSAVEDEDAVAMASEHPRMLLRPFLTGEDDHRRAVLRGDVPPLEPQAVSRFEGDVSVRGAEVPALRRRARRVREAVRE